MYSEKNSCTPLVNEVLHVLLCPQTLLLADCEGLNLNRTHRTAGQTRHFFENKKHKLDLFVFRRLTHVFGTTGYPTQVIIEEF